MKTEQYKVIKGVFNGTTFNGYEIVIAGEERIFDDGTIGISYPKRNCEKIKIDFNPSVISSAFKAGYEQRVKEQLQRALDGLGQNSSYNSEELDKAAEAWAEKHC